MDLKRVLFVGGDVGRLASVKIRCSDIATRLGCEAHYNAPRADDVPGGYQVYVCVKPGMREPEVQKLSRRGLIVWDILDHQPPVGNMRYIASSAAAASTFGHLPSVEVIPHHHCNFDGVFNQLPRHRTIWVGHSHWYPSFLNVDHEPVFIDGMSREQVTSAFRTGTIGLNFRAERPGHQEHQILNSGIKLINCIGFGMPSVSADEPAYREHGEDCTVFAPSTGCAECLARLKADETLYATLRARCVERAHEFHIDQIVGRYRRLLASL